MLCIFRNAICACTSVARTVVQYRAYAQYLCSIMVALLFTCSGCTPRVLVRSNPDARDQGIRYYRPKPYLLISALDKDTAASSDYVSITLDYLPDFSEEYSIHVKSGLGVADVNVGLEDGWNLVSLNQKLDSQTDENIKATADLLKSVASFPNANAATDKGASRPLIKVPARNIPLGYYEAVIGKNRQGKKQLFGFRYVGFIPFQSCPIEMCGSTRACCDDGVLYGLVFDSGIMTFKPLGEIASVLPPSQQSEGSVEPDMPVTRNFSRTTTLKSNGMKEQNVTIQDTGSLPMVIPYSEVERADK